MSSEAGAVPVLAPPPRSPQNSLYADSSPRFNPFDKSGFAQDAVAFGEVAQPAEMTRTDSQVMLRERRSLRDFLEKREEELEYSDFRKLRRLLCSTRT